MSFADKSRTEIVLSIGLYFLLMPFAFFGAYVYFLEQEPLGGLAIILTAMYGLWVDYRFEILIFRRRNRNWL